MTSKLESRALSAYYKTGGELGEAHRAEKVVLNQLEYMVVTAQHGKVVYRVEYVTNIDRLRRLKRPPKSLL